MDDPLDGDSESDASLTGSAEVSNARDHYVNFDKSKLRRPKTTPLGPRYSGSRVSRDALTEDEDEDDPFGGDSSEEDSESEDASRVVLDGDDASSAGGGEVSDEAEGLNDHTPDTDFSDEADSGARPSAVAIANGAHEYAVPDQKVVAPSLASLMKADVERGRAVKKQRTAFDSLLSTRIKLQKSLVGVNTIVGTSSEELHAQRQDADAAIAAAETAAFNLWSTLDGLREDIAAARSGQKRKRSVSTSSTHIEHLWSHMQAQEEIGLIHRDATLERWFRKTRGGSEKREQGLLHDKTRHKETIVNALQQHLSDRQRLIKRAHTPRSCAPLQLANGVTEDDKIYDDADFYGLLLKELLERKSEDSVAASNIDLNFNLRREAKAKKNVDTKASKGRKLRYTVHEKLQNFMAPEDLSTWGERQTDELFGSLFGQRMVLGEEREDDVGMAYVEAEEGGLMLFRS